MSWWDGEYEGNCERAEGHDGHHFDGWHWYDDDMGSCDGEHPDDAVPHDLVPPCPSPDTPDDPEGAEEVAVARDRTRQAAEVHGGAGWTRQSGEEKGT